MVIESEKEAHSTPVDTTVTTHMSEDNTVTGICRYTSVNLFIEITHKSLN